jgi:hypothetical protein
MSAGFRRDASKIIRITNWLRYQPTDPKTVRYLRRPTSITVEVPQGRKAGLALHLLWRLPHMNRKSRAQGIWEATGRGRWVNDNRLAGEKATFAESPITVDEVRLP